MQETSGSNSVYTKCQRIAQLAKQAPQMAMTTLAHHIDLEWLKEAYRRTRKDGAPGVDGQSAEQYAQQLEHNLQELLSRAKAGTYRAPAVRRVFIPKGKGGEKRPIGIPTFEDKVLQRAITMVLEAVYEQDFLDCSYGFRPGRSQHQALKALRDQMMLMRGGWVLELDIRKFYDTLGHEHLKAMVSQRVRDGVVLRLISKWLHAGVMEDGNIRYPDEGTPQGGVISPLLANIYLHEVLDVWFERQVKPRLQGSAYLIRFADDAVMVFANESDARRVMDVLPKRFDKYGLTLHPEKTRLVQFRRPPKVRRGTRAEARRDNRPGTFDFLGFTHYWAVSLAGNWVVLQKTARDRLQRATARTARWLREHMHDKVSEQWKQLVAKVRGHINYYGIAGNWRGIDAYVRTVRRAWRFWLDRRSSKAKMTWQRMEQLLDRYPLPAVRLPNRSAHA